MSAHNTSSTLPAIGAADPLHRMAVYRIAVALSATVWNDAVSLYKCPITRKVAGQLYAATGSIRANLSEGYSRASGADRARLFEYALGSARECRDWYDLARPVLGDQLVGPRDATLVQIVRVLLAIIPRERRRRITRTER
ncbi:MAG TPA: four helix bundle protein [Gemmatimonadaceae bacterium]|nr:four helix bundle protein [Gemmatimonadaceae bacterium]